MGETPSAFNPEDFGSRCGGSRWFRGELRIAHEKIIDKTYPMICVDFDGKEETVQFVTDWHYIQKWLCPNRECAGEMKDSGWTWPTGDPGYHHTCSVCGFTAAIHGATYPRKL